MNLKIDRPWIILIVLKSLDCLDLFTWPSLDWKSHNFKNRDQEKKISGLDTMKNLDKFQKLVSTDWDISILIGLNCLDPQA
jgi:hypothetical protein